MEDQTIIDLFELRSEKAVGELADKYGKLCNRIAVNILKNERDAEECVNDAYLGVWNTIPPQKPEKLGSYVCRIVRNLAVKQYHYNTAQKRNSYYDAALEELSECLPSGENVEETCDARELSQVLNRFLATLDKESRMLFVRRYWYADSVSALAEMFQLNPHTVSVRLSRLRQKLNRFLKEEGIIE